MTRVPLVSNGPLQSIIPPRVSLHVTSTFEVRNAGQTPISMSARIKKKENICMYVRMPLFDLSYLRWQGFRGGPHAPACVQYDKDELLPSRSKYPAEHWSTVCVNRGTAEPA